MSVALKDAAGTIEAERHEVERRQKILDDLPHIIRLDELLVAEYPEPKWIVPAMITEGLTILAGAPKTGKSWFALSLALAVSSGGRVLGDVPVERRGVLYLALEDGNRRLQDRFRKLGAKPNENLHIAIAWPQMGLDALDVALEERYPEVDLLIVDTLQKFRGWSGGQQDYAADYDTLGKIKDLADRHGIALVVLHHTRKMAADDPLMMVSGTLGLTGSADTALVLTKARGEADGELFICGRDVLDQEIALRFDDDCGWVMMGDAKIYRMTKERAEILRVVEEHGPIGPKDVAEMLAKNASTIRVMMMKMEKESDLKKVKYGHYEVKDDPGNL